MLNCIDFGRAFDQRHIAIYLCQSKIFLLKPVKSLKFETRSCYHSAVEYDIISNCKFRASLVLDNSIVRCRYRIHPANNSNLLRQQVLT